MPKSRVKIIIESDADNTDTRITVNGVHVLSLNDKEILYRNDGLAGAIAVPIAKILYWLLSPNHE